ncbi:MAG: ABC transporter ATP-binding protein [Acidobacteria bacterium]|nr:ABC transporter ATP-binding protein [Acidobacteriota bacterium]
MAARNGQPAIRIQDLHKSFKEQTVLNGIDLEVAKGETLTILGRSGTGKSVLLKLIIGLHKPDSGSIQVHGEEVTNLPLDRLNEIRKKIGFSFQYSALYDSLTVEENVAFPLRHHTKVSEAELRDRAHELLSHVGMEEAAKKMPAELSGGMKKRVGLARALALDPDIMLFDEPTAGLDPITAEEIDELIQELQQERKMSSIVVTHDLRSAQMISDRVALLHEGDIRIEGTFEDLKKSDDPFVREFLKLGL